MCNIWEGGWSWLGKYWPWNWFGYSQTLLLQQWYENIMKSDNPPDEFFKYWVLKESYMKYTGLGMNLKLDSFEIIIKDKITLKNDNEDLKFNLFNIENYKIWIASEYEVSDLSECDVKELF